MAKLEDKRVFLICTESPNRSDAYSESIKKHINNAQVFIAIDGSDVLFKAHNYPPDVVIVDLNLPKLTGVETVEHILKDPQFDQTFIIITSPVPDQENFVNEVVTGRVQFLIEFKDEKRFNQCIVKALNGITTSSEPNDYSLKFLTAEDILFNEGDEAKCVYVVKRGELVAFKGTIKNPVILGVIKPGEFVGEMAHINNEPRSATVKATEDCELIEIPRGSLDTILFSKPAWAKALISNLSKRLKRSNQTIANK